MRKHIDVIIPSFHLGNERGGLKYAQKRLERCIKSLDNKCLFLHVDSNIQSLGIEEHNNIEFSFTHTDTIFSPGSSRNICVSKLSNEYIFFVDSDLILNHTLLQEVLTRVKNIDTQGQPSFEMYPCLYLTKEETERFDGDFQGCLESFLRGENHRVEGIALASSCLLMNRKWFLQLGGFDEQFVGHGGEDLELIDRLTRHYPIGPRPDDYALNIKAQHPGNYQGFRRYFSYYALPHLFAGRFLVHQWHPRPLTHPYHKRRAGNDQLLEQMLARSETERGPLKRPVVPCNDLGGELPDFREWMIRLQEEAGYPVQEYPGLLRWQDGIKPKRPLWRKLRKLYLNPRAFFRDMFNPRSR
ncbi:galactosyltransferase-related protein [Aeromonas dhakensis]|uniref:galactosyltransferase-related protein n=1 Tax=Aeromonas dhakensis TaxID=196024 RepID=UPI0038F81532